VKRNFTTDALIMLGAGVSTALLIAGIKTSAPILAGIGVAIALIATVAKLIISRQQGKARHIPLQNTPRRRSTDREHDQVSIPR
jgi:hypothetical protein